MTMDASVEIQKMERVTFMLVIMSLIFLGVVTTCLKLVF